VSAPASTGLLTMREVRERAAAALAPVTPDDPYVFDNIIGTVEPPALILTWADPWLTFRTSRMFDAQFSVMCIAGRVEVDPGIETLEYLQEYTIGRLRDDDYRWPMVMSTSPRRIPLGGSVGGIEYLGATVIYRVPVRI
jgi:hypothetical protein